MNARLRKFLSALSETFWLVPGLMVAAGVLAAVGLIAVDRSGILMRTPLAERWLYDGGGTGARTLLGVIASSTIAVAGTVFSITIAALTLAAGQMGPRLLRNFTRDRGNQLTLGCFLGTFSYALMVLRSIRTQSEGEFIPHLSLSFGIVLAFVCVAVLVFFVGHMAARINVDTVIDLVGDDARAALERLTKDKRDPEPPEDGFWRGAGPARDHRRGYLQHLDDAGLADWAAEHGTSIRMLVRPGAFVFPGAVIALVQPPADGAEAAIRNATALGAQRVSAADLEHAVRQLVEVAVRALSPGINDPFTAMSVLDRLGAMLCDVAPLHLPTGVTRREDRTVLVVPSVDYAGLVDAMFHMIRQNASANVPVLIRLIDVLAAVVGCERDPARVAALQRHADLVLADARRDIRCPPDLGDVCARHHAFGLMRRGGPAAVLAG